MPHNLIVDIDRVEANPTEPITLDEAKAQLIINFHDDNDLITGLITQCRLAVEEYCSVSIVAKTITLFADIFSQYELPYGPVTGILSVQTRTGTEGSGPATYATAESGWGQEGTQFVKFLPSKAGGFNPTVPFRGYFQWGEDASEYSNCGNRYKIVYTTGYTAVPANLKLAILNELVFRYENRGNQQTGICEAAQVLADPFKRKLYF